MRIDAHQHFWKFNPNRDTWIDDTMLVLQNDFLPENLQPLLVETNFNGCIAVQADQSVEETRFLLKLSDKNSFIKGVVGWVNLLDKNVSDTLEIFSKHKKFKGVRYILQAEPDGFMLQDSFLKGISLLEKFNLTYDILVYPNQLKETIKLIEMFPKQKFVLNHLGKPSIKNKEITDWETNIIILASHKNVFCKLSGLVTETNWSTWKEEEFAPYLDVVFEAFGSKRLLFGSDWPVCLLASNYIKVVALIENYIDFLPQKEQAAIMGNNAVKFYTI